MSQSLLIDQIFQDLDARGARLRTLWQMTAAQRIAAMRRGELTLDRYGLRPVLAQLGVRYMRAEPPEDPR